MRNTKSNYYNNITNEFNTKDKRCLVYKREDKFVFFMLADNRINEVFLYDSNRCSAGDIINIILDNYNKGIKGYFGHAFNGEKVLLQDSEIIEGMDIKCSNMVTVQVKREAYGHKCAYVSTKLEMSDEYCVVNQVSAKDSRLSFSKKIPESRKDELKAFLLEEYKLLNNYPGYDILVRTKSKDETNENAANYVAEQINRLNELIKSASTSPVLRCFYKELPDSLKCLDSLECPIIAADEDTYNSLTQILPDCSNISLYSDDNISMAALYGLGAKWKNITNEVVNLKSGGNIYITPTEAMTVIDVNFGKSLAKKDLEDNILNLNMEAACEIAYQINARDISGIIIVDFINMKCDESITILREHLQKCMNSFKNSAKLVDITKLGLFEITRQRKSVSLYNYIEFVNKTILL